MNEQLNLRMDRRVPAVGLVVTGLCACIAVSSGCVTTSSAPSKGAAPQLSTDGQAVAAPAVAQPTEAEAARLAAAGEAAKKEEYESALRAFRELLAENPTLAGAYTGIGDVYERKGDLELAEPAYARAVALDPGDFLAVSSHGRVLEALGRVRDSVFAYQRALTIRPRDVDSNLAMSRLMVLTEQPGSAVIFAERAVTIDPQSGRAHLQLARALSKAGRGTEAIKEYETSCELVEPPSEVMLTLVNEYAKAKRYQEAANAADALTRSAPSAAAYERLGWALFRLNQFDRSDVAYRKAIEIDAAYWPALNGAGVNALNAWVKAGKPADDPRRTEARDMLRRSIKANPDQPKVAALLLKYQL